MPVAVEHADAHVHPWGIEQAFDHKAALEISVSTRTS